MLRGTQPIDEYQARIVLERLGAKLIDVSRNGFRCAEVSDKRDIQDADP